MVKVINSFHQAFIERPIGYFFAAMLGIYIVLLCLGAGHWAAMLGAVAFGFTTNQISLYETGHMSKFMTIVYSAYLFGGTILAYQKKYLAGGVLFAVGMGLSLYNNHIQMTYYLGLFLILYVVIAFGFCTHSKRTARLHQRISRFTDRPHTGRRCLFVQVVDNARVQP